MKRTLSVALVGFLALAGCADRQPIPEEAGYERSVAPIGSYAEYKLVWQSMYKVLQKNFLIRVSRYEDGYIFATSKTRFEGGHTARVKIVGRVIENEDGFFEPQIRVMDQVDLSHPKVYARATRQPTYRWHNIGFDRDMEVQLVNTIEAELLGRENPFSGSPARASQLRKEEAAPPVRSSLPRESSGGAWAGSW